MKSFFDYLLYVLAVTLIVMSILTMLMDWMKSRRERKMEKQREESQSEFGNMDTPALMRHLLANLNCQCKENDDGTLYFRFQGESFWLQTQKDSAWVRIVDLPWYDCSLDELEKMSCMQKAINKVNGSQLCTAVYSIEKDEGKMEVYSKYDFGITSQIHDVEQFLTSILTSFFNLKRDVVTEFEKAKQLMGVD